MKSMIRHLFIFSILGLTLLSSTVFADQNTFKIASKIFIDGKLMTHPVILAFENQKALIVINDFRMELIARNIPKYKTDDAIEINYDIEFGKGKDKIHLKPQIIALPHQESKINISPDGTHFFEMHVLAERK